MLIGGNGARLLRLAGRCADIVSLTGTGRTLADGHHHEVDWTDAAIGAAVAIVQDAASQRTRPVIDALVQHAALTDDRDAVAERVARVVPGAGAAEVLGAPFVLIGNVDQLADEIAMHHDRWGFTSYVVRADAIDAAAALIERLRSS